MTSPTLTEDPAARVPLTARGLVGRFGLPLLLLLITFASTTAVGMRYMHNFELGRAPINDDSDLLPYAWVWQNLAHCAAGLPFAFTLIGILLAHELGHYFACRAYRVDCTLPYMLPAPTLSGTFGAVIRLRSQVRSRRALLVIGAGGPLAGFLVAIGTTLLGLKQSISVSDAALANVQSPLLIAGLARVLALRPESLLPHPILVASWIGLLITALNLIPAGQLDGGHILYALSPRAYRIVGRIVTVVLGLLGVFCWIGWLLWAAILLTPGMRHPRIQDDRKLTGWQVGLAVLCVVVLALSVTYAPFRGYGLLEDLRKLPWRWLSTFGCALL